MCVYAVPPLARSVEPAGLASAAATAVPSCARAVVRLSGRRLDVLAGEPTRISGILEEGAQRAPAGRVLELQRRAGHTWRTLAHARTGAAGRFVLRYTPRAPGSELLRVAFGGDSSTLAGASAARRLEVFRLAGASWYGGGGELACGGELTSDTLGVANRTLPCGTMVTLRYDGHTVRVPVIDRGPFVEGREFDLTEATKRELGFGETGEVWTTS